MNLPQFTAESSLYRSKNVYHEYGGGEGMEIMEMDSVAEVLASGPLYCNPKITYPPGSPCYLGCDPQCDAKNNEYCCHWSPTSKGFCKNIKTDPNNCGYCNKQCSNGEFCSNGLCCPTGLTNNKGICCPIGQTNCNGTCCYGICNNCNGTYTCLESDPYNCGSCGNTCGEGNCCYNGNCISIPPPGQLVSNSNYILYSPGCEPIEGLIISLEITDEMPTCGNLGFSLQLNGYNPQPSVTPISWMQFFIDVSDGMLRPSIQYNQSGIPDIVFEYGNSFYNLNDNKILEGQQLTIALDYDPSGNGNIIGADFYIADNNGTNVLGHGYLSVPSVCTSSAYPGETYNCQVPMVGFQVNVVGSPNACGKSEFSKGAGTLTYKVNGQLLCNQGQLGDLCSGTWFITDEQSNISYSSMSSCCGSYLSQPVAAPANISCSDICCNNGKLSNPNLQTDIKNCGSCGNVCPPDIICSEGICSNY